MKKRLAACLCLLSGIVGGFTVGKMVSKNANQWKKDADKNFSNAILLNQWMKLKQSGKTLQDYFEKMDYKKIVVYGIGHIGERVLDELKDTEIQVIAAVDRNGRKLFAEVPILLPDEEIPEADCMLVTSAFFYDEIVNNMQEKISYPIISLEDVLYEA